MDIASPLIEYVNSGRMMSMDEISEIIKVVRLADKYKANAYRQNITIVNLTEDLLYIAGIVERGTGKPLDKNIPLTKQVLDYVKSKEADADRLAEVIPSLLRWAIMYAESQSEEAILAGWEGYFQKEKDDLSNSMNKAHAALAAHERGEG